MNTLHSVAEFHIAFGVPMPEKPALPAHTHRTRDTLWYVARLLERARREARLTAADGCRLSLRMALELEEMGELCEALLEGDLEAVIDAQIDRRYVADGTTLELGLGKVFDEGFDRVHKANMRKLHDGSPMLDRTGKVKKPDGWVPPYLADLVK